MKDKGLMKHIFGIVAGSSSCTLIRYINSMGYVVTMDYLILIMYG